MNKRTKEALEKVWFAEVFNELPYRHSKAKIFTELLSDGLIQPMTIMVSGVTTKGFQLTHAGRFLYCSQAPGGGTDPCKRCGGIPHWDWCPEKQPLMPSPAEELSMIKRAPVQGWAAGIPWDLHLEAYSVYCKKYGPQKALIEGWCRGGFATEELDVFIPGWRERSSHLARLDAAVSEAIAYIAGDGTPESTRVLKILADSQSDASAEHGK